MIDKALTDWLLEGDVAIQYQTYRDLFGIEKPELKEQIAKEGWGSRYLALQNENGHWGLGFYQPKWISTHYTLLDLRNLELPNQMEEITFILNKIIKENKESDGGINPASSVCNSDVCINGMFLNYACYFGAKEDDLKSVVDFILSMQLADGGFNCHLNRKGARHSSLHTTLSVIEGINEYSRQGYTYRLDELLKNEEESRQFILEHKLFQSHRTGKIINRKFLMLSWPSRWRYDILRALDYFCKVGVNYDNCMDDAMEVLLKKQRKDKRWPLQEKHTGKTHFDMEKTGDPSRWNTLRALRVLKHFKISL